MCITNFYLLTYKGVLHLFATMKSPAFTGKCITMGKATAKILICISMQDQSWQRLALLGAF